MSRKDYYTDWFFIYGIHAPTKTLYMGTGDSDHHGESGVDAALSERAIKGLFILDQLAGDELTILLNNIGGDVYHGMAIYDAVKACRSRVTIKVIGQAFSMASIILQAADHRVMFPHARLMIHMGAGGIIEHPQIVRNWAEESKRSDREAEDIYLERIREKHPAFTRAKLQKMLNFDTILSAQETVDLGLADSIEQ